MKEREFVVRFAIADERGARSSVWRIWKGRGKDDIYIAPRAIVSFAKGSVHASGLCYFSLTAQRHDQMVATQARRERSEPSQDGGGFPPRLLASWTW
jgi:hypothetical protein